ncbi:hypothetical protein LTR85_007929 [Meristemomyces frigidus]|nr:hypothetical protein LTR85_007929 [Meristemomyces frigidus]
MASFGSGIVLVGCIIAEPMRPSAMQTYQTAYITMSVPATPSIASRPVIVHVSSNNRSSQRHRVQGGATHRHLLTVNILLRDIHKAEKTFLSFCSADTQNYALLWHLDTESCSVKRPYHDLYNSAAPQYLRNRMISVHLHRIGGLEKEPVFDTKLRQPATYSNGKGDASRSNGSEEESEDRPHSGDAAAHDSSAAHNGASGTVAQSLRGVHGKAKQSAVTTQPSMRSQLSVDPGSRLNTPATYQPQSSAGSNISTVASKTAVVAIVWTADPVALLGSASPERTTYKIAVNDDLSNLRATIRHAIVDRLHQTEEDRTSFRAGGRLRFRTTIGRRVPGSRLLDIDDLSYGSRLGTVADFFDDADTSIGRLRATVSVVVDDSQSPNTPSKKRITSKSSVNPVDFDKIVRTFHDTTSHEFVRVGNAADRDRNQEDETHIAVEWPLIAETDPPNRKLVDLWRTDGWDFGHDCIGGMVLRKERVRFSTEHDWWQPYKGVLTGKELEGRIFKPVGNDPRFPALPPLMFNIFDPTSTLPPLGVTTLGKKGVQAAVRFVSHLQALVAAGMKFNDNFQLELEESDTQEGILKEIHKELQRDKSSTKRLYSKRLKDSWNIELWVMPQQPGPQKLFRFPTNRPGSSGLVTEFVSQQLLDEGNRMLYIEAHLWLNGSTAPPPRLPRLPRSSRSARLKSTSGDASDEEYAGRSDKNGHAGQLDDEAGDEPYGDEERAEPFDDEEGDRPFDDGGDEQLEHDEQAVTQRTMALSRETADEEALERGIHQSLLPDDSETQQALDQLQHEAWLRNVDSNVDVERIRLGLPTAGQAEGLGEEDFAVDLPEIDFD